MQTNDILAHFGLKPSGSHAVHSPIDGTEIGRVTYDDAKSVEAKISRSVEAFKAWRDVPAPKRGELVRLLGEELRANKEQLGRLVTLEAGDSVAAASLIPDTEVVGPQDDLPLQ